LESSPTGRSYTTQRHEQGPELSRPSLVQTHSFARRTAAALAVAALCAAAFAAPARAATDLRPLLDAPGTTVTLNGSTVYTITEYALTVNKTLLCNGATIQSSIGPIRVSGVGKRLTVDNCVFQGTGWALLGALSGADLVVQNNTRLTGNGANSAIYVDGATLEQSGGSIQGCQWGINMVNADALLSGVSITGTVYAVQNVAGTATLENGCYVEGPSSGNPGTGLGLIASSSYPSRGASAVVHDSTFVRFLNAIDIQPTAAQGLPPGTVEVVGSSFDAPVASALSTVDAVDVRFADSRVTNAQADGIYLQSSTGVIEDSEILDSLNTGVTFLGCQSGAAIRNSLVRGSVHQGVAVGADPASGRVSRYIEIVDNTLRNNVIANVYVDAFSEALVQGNLMSGAPDFSARVHGSPRVDLIGNLLLDSFRGLEMKDGDHLAAALCFLTGHDRGGSLIYNSALASFAHCAHTDNLRNAQAADYSVFVNTGAKATLRRNLLGPAGSRALYNNAGAATTATKNYWSHASGPKTPSNSASGALIGWNAGNGSTLTFQPFMTAAPLDATVNRTFNITAGATTSWAPYADLSLSLTGAAAIGAVSRSVGALRVRDTSTMTTPAPPGGTMSDGIVVVWVDRDLLARAQSGALRLRTAGSGASAGLFRLEPDGSWTNLPTTWDGGAAQVVYDTTDPRKLNGVFALVNLPPDRETRARQLITSYYNDILGRAPEAGAVDAWYDGYFAYSLAFAIDVRFVPQEMARRFFLSAEYAARNRTNEQFIRDCYQTFLRRPPSQSELDTWLAGVWNRPQVVTLFARSAEFETYIQGLFPGLNGVPTRNLVTTMYIGLLDRIVDSGGLAYFADLFEWTYAQGGIEGARNEARNLGRLALASAEYQSKNPTNATHVERLYRAYLGRFPASNELDYWRGELDAGRQTTDSLIDAFAASTEFSDRLNASFGLL
jgi:hypothetical protein